MERERQWTHQCPSKFINLHHALGSKKDFRLVRIWLKRFINILLLQLLLILLQRPTLNMPLCQTSHAISAGPQHSDFRGHDGCLRAADHAHYTVSMRLRGKQPSSPHPRTQPSPFSSLDSQYVLLRWSCFQNRRKLQALNCRKIGTTHWKRTESLEKCQIPEVVLFFSLIFTIMLHIITFITVILQMSKQAQKS